MNKPITKKEWMEYLEKTWNAAQEKALAQPEQEPVAWYYKEGLERGVSLKQETFKWIPLYTTPPQRTWVGLTDEEIQECLEGLPTQTIDVYAKRIEAKLKEKP